MNMFESFALSRQGVQANNSPAARAVSDFSEIDFDYNYMVEKDIKPINLRRELSEDELIEDEGWNRASQTLYESYMGNRNLKGRNRARGASVPSTPQEYGAWGVEFIGQMNHNFTSMAVNVNKLRDMDNDTKFAMYHLFNEYERLPQFSWGGTQRFFKGVLTDPTTYVGLGTLGLATVGRAGAQQMSKSAFRSLLRGSLDPRLLAAYEGAGYVGADDAMRQSIDIQAGVQQELDLGQTLEAATIGAVAGGGLAQLGKTVADNAPAIAGAIREGVSEIGAAADERIAQRAQDTGVTLNTGVDPMPAIDAALSAAGRMVSGDQPVRAEGGLTRNPEKAANDLRLHTNRIQAARETGKPYPGAPKNPRTVIKAPEGSDLPDVVVGDIRPEDWQQRIEAAMSPDEIMKSADWYKKVFGEFRKQAGGDDVEMAKLTDAWFAGQQNSSPGMTLNDVLFVYEQIKRGVPKEQLRGKGLPSANKIVIDILTGSEVTAGAGQKISDFLDSGYGKNVRSFMNNDPDGGSPFVVDVHTARDTGLVDEIYINHLTRLGYDVPNNINVDFGGGGIKGAMYENRALFGTELTEHLNNQNWMGKSDWEPAEVQAIGWMQLSGMYGQSNTGGDVVDAFATNTRRISMEVDPGEGSPWSDKFGADYSGLSDDAKITINDQVTAKAIELVNKREGIDLGGVVHGTGGWELYQNPSTVQQAIASKDTAIRAAARLGLMLNQTEVWVNAPKQITKNPKHFAVDIIEDGDNKLRDGAKLRELFEALVEADPNGLFRGYQPVIIDGQPGIRILIDDAAIKASPLTKKQAQDYMMQFANERLGEITDNLDINAQVDIMEADLTKLRNDWTEDKDGGGYKSYLGGQPGQDETPGQGDIDLDRGELENLFGSLIQDAKGKGTTEN